MSDNKKRQGAVEITHPFKCSTPMQLRLNDIDMMRHLNNTRYFELLDHAKTDYFTRIMPELKDYKRPPMIIANVNIDFLCQTLFHEPVAVVTQVDAIGEKSILMKQQIINSDTGEAKCSCATTMVFIDLHTMRPAPVPDDWRTAIGRFEERDL